MPIPLEPQTLNVLLSDDSEVVRRHLIDLLADLPHVAVTGETETVADTLRAVDQIQPDVIILDINLPDGNGIDVLRYIKRSAPQTEVIMLTNHADTFYRRACLKAGARYFFDKSTEFDQVSEVLHKMGRNL